MYWTTTKFSILTDSDISDEFVRHKVLDLIGDISLAGYRIIGSFYTSHTGHELNIKALRRNFQFCG
ncbi:MAG: UDP-3-O-acyl-N-acetylglucosamine deacetylase [Alphaproteobacteria bacterium]